MGHKRKLCHNSRWQTFEPSTHNTTTLASWVALCVIYSVSYRSTQYTGPEQSLAVILKQLATSSHRSTLVSSVIRNSYLPVQHKCFIFEFYRCLTHVVGFKFLMPEASMNQVVPFQFLRAKVRGSFLAPVENFLLFVANV